MPGERDKKLSAASIGAAIKNKAAKRSNRQRARQVRPWKVLREEWFEEIGRVFPTEFEASPWGPAEEALARKLLKDVVELDTAIGMAKRFIAHQRQEGGVPAFKLFWAMRDTFRAQIDGTLGDTKTEKEKREWDPKEAEESPDIGW